MLGRKMASEIDIGEVTDTFKASMPIKNGIEIETFKHFQ